MYKCSGLYLLLENGQTGKCEMCGRSPQAGTAASRTKKSIRGLCFTTHHSFWVVFQCVKYYICYICYILFIYYIMSRWKLDSTAILQQLCGQTVQTMIHTVGETRCAYSTVAKALV